MKDIEKVKTYLLDSVVGRLEQFFHGFQLLFDFADMRSGFFLIFRHFFAFLEIFFDSYQLGLKTRRSEKK